TVPVAMGSAINSQNAAAGFFNGALDEVRIWEHARSAAEIQSTINGRLTGQVVGLVARWGLDEGFGDQVTSTAALTATGTIVQPGAAWIEGAPLDLAFNQPPQTPVLGEPPHHPTGGGPEPALRASVLDPNGGDLTVTWYGRAVPAVGPDFPLIGLPDTQYYTGELNGGVSAMFHAQTNWVVSNRVAMNIPYVVQLGDCVENGQNGGNPIEWMRADTSLSI